jgi:hypothetical protein
MPGFLLDTSATLMCVHGGQAEPAVPTRQGPSMACRHCS